MNVIYLLFRNGRSRRGVKLPRGRVSLEYFDDELNLGDHLSRAACFSIFPFFSVCFLQLWQNPLY